MMCEKIGKLLVIKCGGKDETIPGAMIQHILSFQRNHATGRVRSVIGDGQVPNVDSVSSVLRSGGHPMT